MRQSLRALFAAAIVAVPASANAVLIDRGGGLIYDTVLNVTWLADANYARTSGYSADGLMMWSEAMGWVANLSYYDSVRGVTYSDWRLPTVNPINGVTENVHHRYDGLSDRGYNISAPGSVYAGSTNSEMAHLFHNSLGNYGHCEISGSSSNICQPSAPGWGLSNAGPFTNFVANSHGDAYWSSSTYGAQYYGSIYAYDFIFASGAQGGRSKSYSGDWYPGVTIWYGFALAVRDGDVIGVPEPGTLALLALGLAGLGFARRRKLN